MRVRLRHGQIEVFGHGRADAAALDGDEGGVLRATLALGVAVVALADCDLGRRDVQSCQNLGASEAHAAVGADAVGAQSLGQAEAGRKEPIGQGIIGQHDRLARRADLDLVLGQQLGDLVRHEPHVPIGFLDELTGLGAIQDIEKPRVLSHTARLLPLLHQVLAHGHRFDGVFAEAIQPRRLRPLARDRRTAGNDHDTASVRPGFPGV